MASRTVYACCQMYSWQRGLALPLRCAYPDALKSDLLFGQLNLKRNDAWARTYIKTFCSSGRAKYVDQRREIRGSFDVTILDNVWTRKRVTTCALQRWSWGSSTLQVFGNNEHSLSSIIKKDVKRKAVSRMQGSKSLLWFTRISNAS